MKVTSTSIWFVLILLLTIKSYGQEPKKILSTLTIETQELKPLIGEWTGFLTYIDYSSNKPYTMPADLKVEQGDNENEFQLFNIYPNEPKANNKEIINISKNGQELNRKQVTSKKIESNGSLKIITEHSGMDNNLKALIRIIYTLGDNQFVIKKEVQYESSKEWIIRNEYDYKRKN